MARANTVELYLQYSNGYIEVFASGKPMFHRDTCVDTIKHRLAGWLTTHGIYDGFTFKEHYTRATVPNHLFAKNHLSAIDIIFNDKEKFTILKLSGETFIKAPPG